MRVLRALTGAPIGGSFAVPAAATPRLLLCAVLCGLFATPAAAYVITPANYSFSGVFTDVTVGMDQWMPGVENGADFFGTFVITPSDTNPETGTALFDLFAGTQHVHAFAVGGALLEQFASGQMNGLAGSPTITSGFIDEVRFIPVLLGLVQFRGFGIDTALPNGSIPIHATGEVRSISTPEPAALWLTGLFAVGLLGALQWRRRHK